MILSNKYIIKEDSLQITLIEKYQSKVKESGKYTGETTAKERTLGYYSNSPTGRSQCYTRVINNEISELEKQTLENILNTVQRCEEQVKDFWESTLNK